jgi:hypothetical protein
MITHYAITTELARQRRAEIAASVATSRRPRFEGRRRWTVPSLRQHRLSDTAPAAVPAGPARATGAI